MYDRAVPKAADLSFSLIESHGSIQSTVSEAPQVHVVFKDVQHHRELGEHQCLKVRRDKLGSDSWAYINASQSIHNWTSSLQNWEFS